MNDMVLAKSANFNGVVLDCYVEPEQENVGDFWATRTQIGQLLGYSDPKDAIAKIHQRNKERLDRFSAIVKLPTPSRGGQNDYPLSNIQDVTVYNFKGLLEICRYSNQPKANDIMDWLWSVADEIRRTGSYITKPQVSLKENIEVTRAILEIKHIEDNQLILALDKIYRRYTGFSMLETTGIQLEAKNTKQSLTPTQIGEQLGISARAVNSLLAEAGYQHKIVGKWEALEPGLPYSVMLDTGKAHSDGTPVCQLKWYSDIIPVLERLMEDCA